MRHRTGLRFAALAVLAAPLALQASQAFARSESATVISATPVYEQPGRARLSCRPVGSGDASSGKAEGNVEQCRPTTSAPAIVGYDVHYRIGEREYHTMMSYDPGPQMSVDDAGNVR